MNPNILKVKKHSPGDFLWGRLSWKRIMISLVEIYILLCIGVWLIADKIIHHPPARKYDPLPGEISFTASDGVRLSAVWLPHPKATHTLLISHGNGEDLNWDYPTLKELQSAGLHVFAYDYRGYGHSKGNPTEKGLYRDIEAAYAHLTGPLKIPPEQIVLLGRSLGGGPSCHLAARKPVGGIILESTYTTAFRVVIPFPLFPFGQFPNLKNLQKTNAPLLIIHGTRDTIITPDHGRKLFESYHGPKQHWWVEGADHNDVIPMAGMEYPKRIKKFTDTLDGNPILK